MQNRYHLDRSYVHDPIDYGNIQLFQIGRLYCLPTDLIAPHYHVNWFELTIITDGKGTITTNGTAIPVQKGDIYLSFPHDVHAIESDENAPLRYDFFSFQASDEEKSKLLAQIMRDYASAESRLFSDPLVGQTVNHAISEFIADNTYKNQLLSAYFETVLLLILRNFSPSTQSLEQTDKRALCFAVMHYIDTHLLSLKYVSELTHVFPYSYHHLAKLFQKTTSQSLTDYYTKQRFELAKHLLTKSNLSVGEVSEKLNYATPYAFSKAFKNHTGIAPRAAKKQDLR